MLSSVAAVTRTGARRSTGDVDCWQQRIAVLRKWERPLTREAKPVRHRAHRDGAEARTLRDRVETVPCTLRPASHNHRQQCEALAHCGTDQDWNGGDTGGGLETVTARAGRGGPGAGGGVTHGSASTVRWPIARKPISSRPTCVPTVRSMTMCLSSCG